MALEEMGFVLHSSSNVKWQSASSASRVSMFPGFPTEVPSATQEGDASPAAVETPVQPFSKPLVSNRGKDLSIQ